MQDNLTAKEIAKEIMKGLKSHFGNKIKTFSIHNLTDTPYKMFNISFDAYNYFYINFSYNRGSIGCSISSGKYGIDLDNSQKWYDQADMNIFFKELEQQLELRIPDKFLEYHGWK